jgi:hypothetical protein
MPDQLFTHYIENSLVIISINNGSWWAIMVIRVDTEIWEIGKDGLKGGLEKGCVGGGGCIWDAGFCGPCVCLSVFLML